MEIKNGNARCLLGGECGQKSAPFVSELSEKRPANSRPPKTRFPPSPPPSENQLFLPELVTH